MYETIVHFLTETIMALGYPGIAALMFIESSFVPFPSEVVLPPAGYLAANGQMNAYMAFGAGLLGSLTGALFNYGIAVYVGEPFLRSYGKYFFVKEAALDRAEKFFKAHGEISTFVGRLVPVVRQLISVPAGLARMNLRRFAFFTSLGAGIWCAILVYIGYLHGRHEEALKEAVVAAAATKAFMYLVPVLAILVTAYVIWHRRRTRGAEATAAE
jgi:membrane protein DedA with SNARE-associated domain